MSVLLIGINMYSYKISFFYSAITIVVLMSVVMGSVFFVHKKDEMQSKVIQKAMSSSFVTIMAISLGKGTLEVLGAFGWIDKIDFELNSMSVVVIGLTSLVFNLYLENRKYRVGKNDGK
ncbi:MAG: hypothetical protein ACRCSG_04895 [Cellulosilyticaceae bacterium]